MRTRGLVFQIDDNAANRTLIEMILRMVDGVTCRSFETAEDALAELETVAPSLILMDINLPGMSGTEAIRVCRSRAHLKDVTIAAISADATAKTIQDTLDAGCDTYIPKPIDVPRIRELAMATLQDGVKD